MAQRTYVGPSATCYSIFCERSMRDVIAASQPSEPRFIVGDEVVELPNAHEHVSEVEAIDPRMQGQIPRERGALDTTCRRGHEHVVVRVAPLNPAFPVPPTATPPLAFTDAANRFELSVLRYENLSEDWLIIRVCASFAGEVWSASDPSLQATDLPRIADWFDDVAAGTAVDAEMVFVEPNLRTPLHPYFK
jgi:hypothetical protein